MNKLLLFSLVILFPVSVLAYQNEPDGFRGVKWGADLSKMSDMSSLPGRKGVDQAYVRKGDKLAIGDAELESISYIAYKKRLIGVLIRYRSIINYQRLKETLFEVYGTGRKPNRFIEEFIWEGNVGIMLKYSRISKKGTIFYTYNPIRLERKNDMKKKGGEAAKDL